MRTFVRIAERGNLAAVSRETGAGQSTVTRHLRELEEALGVSLLTRTTRRTALTDESSLKDTPQGEELPSSRGPIGSVRLRGAFKLQLSKKNTME